MLLEARRVGGIWLRGDMKGVSGVLVQFCFLIWVLMGMLTL